MSQAITSHSPKKFALATTCTRVNVPAGTQFAWVYVPTSEAYLDFATADGAAAPTDYMPIPPNQIVRVPLQGRDWFNLTSSSGTPSASVWTHPAGVGA